MLLIMIMLIMARSMHLERVRVRVMIGAGAMSVVYAVLMVLSMLKAEPVAPREDLVLNLPEVPALIAET